MVEVLVVVSRDVTDAISLAIFPDGDVFLARWALEHGYVAIRFSYTFSIPQIFAVLSKNGVFQQPRLITKVPGGELCPGLTITS
jgi:hypothetical protein